MTILTETVARTNITVSNPYQFYVDAVVRDTLTGDQLALYQEVNDAYANCFSEAKQKNLTLAEEYKAKGNALIGKAEEKTLALISVFSMPFISYYYYKIRHYELAVQESELIIGNCLKLERTDYEYLFFCRIQQEQNIGRIAWANNQVEKAIAIYSQCLLDIYNKGQQWAVTRIINAVPVSQLIKTTQYLFLLQVLSEMLAQIIARYVKDKQQAFSHLHLFIHPLSQMNLAQLDSLDPAYRTLNLYLQAFVCLAAGREEEFAQQAYAYMDDPHSEESLRKLMARYLYYFGLV